MDSPEEDIVQAGQLTKDSDQDNTTKQCTTLEDMIETLGFGRFHIFLMLGVGFFWVADSMEIMVVSILSPLLVCEWNLNSLQEAMITTVVFIGQVRNNRVS